MSRLLKFKEVTPGNWWNYDSYLAEPFFASGARVNIDDDYLIIVRFSGARSYKYLWSDITVQIGDGPVQSFDSKEELTQFCIENKHPYFDNSTNSEPPTVTTIFRAGDVLEISRPIEYFTNNFDLEDPESDTYGQGKNERVGWWLETGKGGTNDTRNKFKFQWNPQDNVKYPLGDIGGFENAVLLAHKHNTLEYSDGKFGVNTLGTGASSAGRAISESGATAPIDETSLFGIDENGSPSPTEDGEGKNMPPYIVTAFAMRTEDLVIIGGGNAIPSLPQVLAIGDRTYKEVSDEPYQFEIADRSTDILSYNDVLLDDADDVFPENAVLLFKCENTPITASFMNADVRTAPDWQTGITSITINVGDQCKLKKVTKGVESPLWLLDICNKGTGGDSATKYFARVVYDAGNPSAPTVIESTDNNWPHPLQWTFIEEEAKLIVKQSDGIGGFINFTGDEFFTHQEVLNPTSEPLETCQRAEYTSATEFQFLSSSLTVGLGIFENFPFGFKIKIELPNY